MILRRRVMDDRDIPDASLEVFQWPYDGKSDSIDDPTKYHAYVDGTYIVASVGTDPTIAFGFRIVSKSGTYTQAEINSYASSYRITIAAPEGYYFPRIDLCGIATNGFQGWGQTYLNSPTNIGYLEYGAALVISYAPSSLEAANNTNSGGISPQRVLTWTLDGFEDQTVTTPICYKNYFAVLEEVRNYATYDSTWSTSGQANPTITTTMADDMFNDSRYDDSQLKLFDNPTGLGMNIGDQVTGIPGLNSGPSHSSTLGLFPDNFPILMEYFDKTNLISHPNTYSSSSPQSMGATSGGSYTMNINNTLAFKFRTNFQNVKLSYPSGTNYKYIQFISMNTTTTYNLRTGAFSAKFIGVSDCEFWVVFKIGHYYNSSGATQQCKLTFTQSEASGSTTSMDFSFSIILNYYMIIKTSHSWLIPNNSTGITNWGGTSSHKHWIAYRFYMTTTSTGEDLPGMGEGFIKVGPPIGKLSATGMQQNLNTTASGPWEMYGSENRIGGGTIGTCRAGGVIQLFKLPTNSSNKPYIKIIMYTQNPEDGNYTPTASHFVGKSYLGVGTVYTFESLASGVPYSMMTGSDFPLKLRATKGTENYSGSSVTSNIMKWNNSGTWVINTVFSPVQSVS